MADWIGRTVSKVEIQQLLGRGGMAEVYLGRHTTLGRLVAVKVLLRHLSDDPELLSRFQHEAHAVAALRHSGIVQIFDYDVADDRPYMVMEYIAGPSLAEYLHHVQAAGRTLGLQTAARVTAALAAALDTAHAHGIIHRDLKPANVLLRRDAGPFSLEDPLPGDVEPVLTDFGVVRMVGATRVTAAGRIYGTPSYMSPEQARGEDVDARSDIYSLGVVLYEMLTGRPPFDSQDETPGSLLIKHITARPPRASGLPPGVQAVLDRGLAKQRESRYQAAGDLATDLLVAVGEPDTVAVRAPGGGPPADETPRTVYTAAPATTPTGSAPLAVLRNGEIFQGLDDAFLQRVAGMLVEQRMPARTVIFHRGDPGDVLYIVLEGRVKIYTRDAAGAERVLGYNTPGNFFGEMALLTGEPRSASAEAVVDSRLLLLTKDDFDHLLATNPSIQRTMLQVFARRQAASNRLLMQETFGPAPAAGDEGQVVVLLSPKGGAGVSTLAVNLAATLARAHPGRVALLDLGLPFGNAPLLLNLAPRTSLAAIRPETLQGLDPSYLHDYLVPHSTGVRVLAGVARLEEAPLVTPAQVEAGLALLRRAFRYVVVDTAPSLSEPVLAAVAQADRVLLLIVPDRAAVRALREVQRFLVDVRGVPRERLFVVLNQPTAHATLTREEFLAGMDPRPEAALPYGGGLPAAAARRGEPFVLLEPDAPLSLAVGQLARTLAGVLSAKF